MNLDNHAVADRDGHVYAVTEILAFDKRNDIAIARLEGADFDAFALKADAPVGSTVLVLSHPNDMLYALTQGTITRYYLPSCACCRDGKAKRFAITADYARGSSGAPVLDVNGNVVGMVCATSSVYHHEEANKKEELQMVVKRCIPAASILALIEGGAR